MASEAAMYQAVSDTTYTDVFPLIQTALAELSSGQLIKSDRLDLLDLMGAIEIMDPRTDSFLPSLTEEKSLPRFDPSHDFADPVELIWIFDQLIRLEVGFHQGHPLASTLFTCQYFRPLALRAVSTSSAASKVTGSNRCGEELRMIVLRAMLMGMIKSTEIVWEELCKGQVYENEDVLLSTANLTFPSLLSSCYPASPFSIGQEKDGPVVTVDDVLATLDNAIEWINISFRDVELRDALAGRLSLRVHLVYTLAILSSPPHTSPITLIPHIARTSRWISTLATSTLAPFVPPLILRAIFVRQHQMPLAIKQPVRIVALHSVAESWEMLADWWQHISEAVSIWGEWNDGRAGWNGIYNYFTDVARNPMNPYPRSLHASIISSSAGILFGVASPRLITLSASFFYDKLGIPLRYWVSVCGGDGGSDPSSSVDLVAIDPSSSHSAAVLGFVERLANALLHSLNTLLQNRARGRRWVCKNMEMWINLIDEARDLLPYLLSLVPAAHSQLRLQLSLIPLAISSQLLTITLEAILCGFESNVDLYSTAEERIAAWWACERIASTLQGNLAQANEAKLTSGAPSAIGMYTLQADDEQERVISIKYFCKASRGMEALYGSSSGKAFRYESPFFLSSTMPQSTTLQSVDLRRNMRSRFERRFKWIRGIICVFADQRPALSGSGSGSMEWQPLESLVDWFVFEKEVVESPKIIDRIELQAIYHDISATLVATGLAEAHLAPSTAPTTSDLNKHRSMSRRRDLNKRLLSTSLANELFLSSQLVQDASATLESDVPTSAVAEPPLGVHSTAVLRTAVASSGDLDAVLCDWFSVYRSSK